MTEEAFKKLVRATAVLCVAVGGFGSILCLPYAVTSNWNLVAISGVYFIAGGVMIVGGLITLSVLLQSAK